MRLGAWHVQIASLLLETLGTSTESGEVWSRHEELAKIRTLIMFFQRVNTLNLTVRLGNPID